MGLNDVQQTLFFPLIGRARAAREWPGLFRDPWAEQAIAIRDAEGSVAEHVGLFPTVTYGLRHLVTIIEINKYLREHPGAAVVNLGCGLDRLVDELDDPEATVYNLDFPEVLEARNRWVDRSDREADLAYSITDHRWLDDVDGSRGMVAVAAGVFYYLEVSEVRALTRALADRFPGGRLCFDAESPRVTAVSEWMIRRSGTPDARMPFRLRDPRSIRGWSTQIADVHIEYDFSTYLRDKSLLPWPIRATFATMRLVKGMYEAAITFR